LARRIFRCIIASNATPPIGIIDDVEERRRFRWDRFHCAALVIKVSFIAGIAPPFEGGDSSVLRNVLRNRDYTPS
jgi:hypothetical protein